MRTTRPKLLTLVVATIFIAVCAVNTRASSQFDWILWLQNQKTWPALLLLGEQHDAPEHQSLATQAVTQLAAQQRLAAVVLEMAERGGSTQGLARDATEPQVQTALRWREAGWDWPTYASVVMAAVRAGVPVLGGNLPRGELRTAMQNPQLATELQNAGGAPAVQAQERALREGHCGLLPETQIQPMLRVQVARDQSLALTLREQEAIDRAAQASALAAGRAYLTRTVLLLAGSQHADTRWGVPLFLNRRAGEATTPSALSVQLSAASDSPPHTPAEPTARAQTGFDARIQTAAPPAKDYCASLRQRFTPPPPATAPPTRPGQ